MEKQNPGENADTWGARLNGNVIDLVDEAMDGVNAMAVSGSVILSTANGSSDQARKRVQNVTGGAGGTVTIPNTEKLYFVRNASSADVTITTGSGTNHSVKAGNTQWVFCDGANNVFPQIVKDFGNSNLATSGSLAAGNTTVNGTFSVSGNATLGDASSDAHTFNGQLIVSKAMDVSSANATILMNGTNGGWINCGAGLNGSPTAIGPGGVSRSIGTKLVLLSGGSAGVCDLALGISNPGSSQGMWFSVADAGGAFRWYGGTSLIASLDGLGNLTAVNIPNNTTASAANVFVTAAGLLQKSTSSARFKTAIEPLDEEYANRWLEMTPIYYRSLCEGDRKEWGWYGFLAEDAANAGLPQLVHWTYAEEDWEEFEIEQTNAVDEETEQRDGTKETVSREIVQISTQRRIKPGAVPTVPDGYQYERDGPFAQFHIKKLYAELATLKAELAALRNA